MSGQGPSRTWAPGESLAAKSDKVYDPPPTAPAGAKGVEGDAFSSDIAPARVFEKDESRRGAEVENACGWKLWHPP